MLERSVIRRGDADAALAGSAHVVSGTWQTQRIEHLFLEPESALAEPLPDGTLRLYSQGQGIFDDRRQVARFLGMARRRIYVELVPNGGAFGGKEDMSVQAQTALLAQMTGAPVKLTLTREESIRMHPKRHPLTMDYTVGCDADGRLTAVKARMLGDSGAYASVGGKVLERAAGHSCGAVRGAARRRRGHRRYTNNPPCGAMRGFGANQAHFAMEGCLDLLAKKAGLDGWEIRWRNVVERRRHVRHRPGAGEVGRHPQDAARRSRTPTTRRSAPGRPWASAAASRTAASATASRSGASAGSSSSRRHRVALQRLHRDGPGPADHAGAVRRRGHRAAGVAVFAPKVDSTFALGCGQTTGSRGTLFAGTPCSPRRRS